MVTTWLGDCYMPSCSPYQSLTEFGNTKIAQQAPKRCQSSNCCSWILYGKRRHRLIAGLVCFLIVDLWSVFYFIFLILFNWHLKVIKIQLWLLPLCLAFWDYGVVEKVSISGRSAYYVMTQPFSSLHNSFTDEKQTNMAPPWGAQIQRGKKKILLLLILNHCMKHANENTDRFFFIFRPTCFLAWSPL